MRKMTPKVSAKEIVVFRFLYFCVDFCVSYRIKIELQTLGAKKLVSASPSIGAVTFVS